MQRLALVVMYTFLMMMKGVALVVTYTFLVMVVAPKAITCVAYQGSVSQRYGCVTLTMTVATGRMN